MNDKRSSKRNSENWFKLHKATLSNRSHSLSSYSRANSNRCDAGSTLSARSVPLVNQRSNFEGITLIWYDPRISRTEDTTLTYEELRTINDYVREYSDQTECVKYIRSIENEKIFLIISGKKAKSILEEVHQLKQIHSIFIFCAEVKKNEVLSNTYGSIVGIYSKRSRLIDAIKQHVDLLQKHLDSFILYNEQSEKATRDISKESAEFLWFQLFKDVFLRMPSNDQAKNELISFAQKYYRGNAAEYDKINEFAQSYASKDSIYWYTKESFLYRLLNKALRTEDIGQIQIFRFFIKDLSSKLAELYEEQNWGQKSSILLYRGLKMGIDELNRLKQNVGSIISTNGFLSTSHLKAVAIRFATQGDKRKKTMPTLYEIECDFEKAKSVIFADITKYSKYAGEQEVLFDLSSTFQIESISDDEHSKMVVIKLIATDAGIETAKKYIELNRKRNEETTSDILFGILLKQMGKYDESLSYFTNLLNGSNEKMDKARIYNEIGAAYLGKGEVDKGLKHTDLAYQKMIKVRQCRIKDSIRPITIMGHVYLRRENYEDALDCYFEALEIAEKFYGLKHLDTAVAWNHIGNVYYKMEDYSKSLIHYEKSYEIRKKQLPEIHLDIAASLNNLGLVQWKRESPDDALSSHKQALNIRQQLLPSNHHDIIQSLHNIISVLYEERRFIESLEYFTELLTLQKINFDPNDHQSILSRLKKEFGSGENDMIQPFSTEYAVILYMRQFPCESRLLLAPRHDRYGIYRLHMEDARALMPSELSNKQHRSILEDFIKTLKIDDDYTMVLKKVKEVLRVAGTASIFDSNDTNYLVDYLRDLVEDAYDSTDASIQALRFYDKVRFILENELSHLINTRGIHNICRERIELKQQKDHSVLKNFLNIIDTGGDFNTALKAVRSILIASRQTFISGYSHRDYLMERFYNLVKDTYDSADETSKALEFYEKVQSLLETLISHWIDNNIIQIICLERMEYIYRIKSKYEPAIEALEKCISIQREIRKDLYNVPDRLRSIGLMHMMLGNYKSALKAFKTALKLVHQNSDENDRDIRLLQKRIKQAKEGLELSADLVE